MARMPLPRILGCRRLDQGYVICAENRGVGLEQHGPVHGCAGAQSCEVRSCGWSPRLSLETGLESVPRAGLRLAVARLLGLRRRLRLRVVCAWLDLSLGRLEPVLGL